MKGNLVCLILKAQIIFFFQRKGKMCQEKLLCQPSDAKHQKTFTSCLETIYYVHILSNREKTKMYYPF